MRLPFFLSILLLMPGLGVAPLSAGSAPVKYAGTYKIDSWRDYEARSMFHFFYLQPDGAFLLGAEWPGKESSRAAGSWSVSGERLSLSGTIRVSTNKGEWRVPFVRSYRITIAEQGIRLDPVPVKNRFGLLGWPNAYHYFRARISPNLPGRRIPSDPEEMRALIRKLSGGGP